MLQNLLIPGEMVYILAKEAQKRSSDREFGSVLSADPLNFTIFVVNRLICRGIYYKLHDNIRISRLLHLKTVRYHKINIKTGVL